MLSGIKKIRIQFSFVRFNSVASNEKIAEIPSVIKAKDLARILDTKIDKVASFARLRNYLFYKNSDLILDFKTSCDLAIELGYTPKYVELDITRRDYWDEANNDSKFPRRPLIVSVVGHVNHGKTTLLDRLRKTNVVESEPGKITQSLSAFSVPLKMTTLTKDNSKFQPKNNKNNTNESNKNNIPTTITMLDTPGHAAFFLMRENGASVSDFLLIVIDAIEGIQPQTEEVFTIAQNSNMPMIICINKIDIAGEEKIENVYKQLHKRELINPEITHQNNAYMKNILVNDKDFPAKSVIEISALKGLNVDLLVNVLFQKAEQIDEYLHPDSTDTKAECTVIESGNQTGIGRTLFSVVHWGFLESGQWFVTDRFIGKIKSLYNDRGEKIKKCLPGHPVQIVGIDTEQHPPSGSGLFVLPQEEAEILQQHRENLVAFKVKEMRGTIYKPVHRDNENQENDDEGYDYEYEYENEEGEKPFEGIVESENATKNGLAVVLKADNIGRLETLLGLCDTIASEGNLDVRIIHSGVGDVTPRDLFHAQVEIEEMKEKSVPIYCFGKINLDASAKRWLEKHKHVEQINEGISIHQFGVIYDLIDEMKKAVERRKKLMAGNKE
jgi:translation initiation factor IF-2